jgi:hypothetical protein
MDPTQRRSGIEFRLGPSHNRVFSFVFIQKIPIKLFEPPDGSVSNPKIQLFLTCEIRRKSHRRRLRYKNELLSGDQSGFLK